MMNGVCFLLFIGHTCLVNSQVTGDLRIIGKHLGRLEIFYNDTWGTVCNNHFDNIDATVACRQLGYSTGTPISADIIDDGFGAIWLDDVNCKGREVKLMDCTYTEKHNCKHYEDVGIQCFSICRNEDQDTKYSSNIPGFQKSVNHCNARHRDI